MDVSDKTLRVNRDLSHEKHKMFPPEKRIEVVTKWMALGNMRLVSELTGVSYGLCRIWKQQPWWADLVNEIRASRDIQVDNKLSKLVDRSLDIISDRLDNGNIVWNKKVGEYDRVPVNLKDTNKVANDLLNQQLNLSKKKVIESQADQKKTVQDQIAMLAQEFAKFNKGRTINVQARIVEEPSAIHDERASGLPEAVRQVRREAGSDQEEGREERSESDGDESDWSQDSLDEGRGSYETTEQGWEEHSEQPESSVSTPQPFVLPQF